MPLGSLRRAVARYARRLRALLVDDVTVLFASMLITIVVTGVIGLLIFRWLVAAGLASALDGRIGA